jgi:hypothetical protein
MLLNGLARMPSRLVQGAGRADLQAKVHLEELPFYLPGLWWLLTSFGIEGVAIAWVVRAAVDPLLLFIMALRFLPTGAGGVRRAALKLWERLWLYWSSPRCRWA